MARRVLKIIGHSTDGCSVVQFVMPVTFRMLIMYGITTLFLSSTLIVSLVAGLESSDVLVITFPSNSGDPFHRFLQSAEQLNYNVKVLDSTCPVGSSIEKPLILKNALEEYKTSEDLLILFVASYDALLLYEPQELANLFRGFHAKVVFSARAELQNASLEEQFPNVKEYEKRFLSSEGFIGYASDVYAMLLEAVEIFGSEFNQMSLMQLYLNPMRRATLGMKLDSNSIIFQYLDGTNDDLSIQFKSGTETVLFNSKTQNYPAVLMGSVETANQFSFLANYIPNRWTTELGCTDCQKNPYVISDQKVDDYPTVMLAIFIEYPTPFLEEFFENIIGLTYPKFKIDLFIHRVPEMHENEVNSFIANHGANYRSVQLHNSSTVAGEFSARKQSFNEFLTKSTDYYMAVDGIVQLENSSAIEILISRNGSFVAPLLTRPGKLWSNFWGALSETGFYARSHDYEDIVSYRRLSLWNVPFVMNAYLIKAAHVKLLSGIEPVESFDADMVICQALRQNGVFMYVDNTVSYGHLVDPDYFETSHLHNDMYEIFSNRYTWEKKYIANEYFNYLNNIPYEEIEQPCPDVFWMPLASSKLCRDLIEEMEHYGKWSGGKHQDERLAGGYENVPTVDIHTNQIGWERHWLYILSEYVKPLNAKVFHGYHSEARAIMNFVVRYRPGEMDRLTPHHDASTYTINVALNRPGIDYQGGGPRFLRYNCSVTDIRLGWMLMHPGRLTHYHEGLPVTGGTRYIMVSFIDP